MRGEIGTRFLKALGIDPEKRRIKAMGIKVGAFGTPIVAIEEMPDEPAIEGLVLVVSEYMLVPKGPLWIVGQFREQTEHGTAWDFQGIFLERDEAVRACKGQAWFVAPVTIGETLETDRFTFRGVEYPLAQEAINASSN